MHGTAVKTSKDLLHRESKLLTKKNELNICTD